MGKVKVAQCWDDGVVTDIRLTEILRRHHAKATFNLNPGNHGAVRREPSWQAPGESGWCCRGFMPGKLAAGELTQVYDGFQVASHCWKHETAGTVSDEAFLKAAVDARAYLEDLFQRPCHGFAWPCGVVTDHTADLLLEAGFEIQYLLGRGVVYDVASTIDIFVLKYGTEKLDIGIATAAGMFKSVVAIFLLIGANLVAKALDEDTLF